MPLRTDAAPPTDETCRAAGMFFHVNQCVSVDPAGCPAMGLVYDSDNDRCVAISAASCGAAGQRYDPVGKKCVATCGEGTEPVDNACLSVCRNNDRNGRFYYDPQAFPFFSNSNFGEIPPPPVERTGGCVCPPGPAGDNCRELDRSHGTTTVKLPFAHSPDFGERRVPAGAGRDRWRDGSRPAAVAGPRRCRRRRHHHRGDHSPGLEGPRRRGTGRFPPHAFGSAKR